MEIPENYKYTFNHDPTIKVRFEAMDDFSFIVSLMVNDVEYLNLLQDKANDGFEKLLEENFQKPFKFYFENNNKFSINYREHNIDYVIFNAQKVANYFKYLYSKMIKMEEISDYINSKNGIEI